MSRLEIAAGILFTIVVVVAIAIAISGLTHPAVSTGHGPQPKQAAFYLSSVYSAAVQAGADFGGRKDVRSIAELLRQGVNGTGVFRDSKFQIEISPEELDLAEPLLRYDHGNRRMVLK